MKQDTKHTPVKTDADTIEELAKERDYAIESYHREKEARRDAQRERDELKAQVEGLRDAIEDTLAFAELNQVSRDKLKAALGSLD